MRWWQAPLYALGVVIGFACAFAVLAFSLVVVVIHVASFALCSVGLHRGGCWIRRNMTTPVLDGLATYGRQLQDYAAKKSGL